MSYQETFVAGDGEAGAYVCQLLITSAGLTLAPGGAPQAFVAPAARKYATSLAAKITTRGEKDQDTATLTTYPAS